ncbi:sensor histidine kinase [Kribbella capetownensis]|uniref:sensor histidine kinase n=1 Tax=Kribbella capetownensis TaxID=1572659 RepID=UPI00192E0653|nr:sensor histidine kinase [Kribbella capetownensis]
MSHATSPASRALAAGRRLTHAPGLPITGAVVLALLALIQVTGATTSNGPASGLGNVGPVAGGPPTFALLLGLLGTAPVAFVRTHLLPVALVVTLANALTLAGGYVPTLAATVALVVVVFLVARQRAPRVWLPLLLPFVVFLAIPLGAVGGHEDAVAVVLTLSTVAGLVGSTARSRSESAARRESEEHLVGSMLENAARGERARIARELHDVVAHHISMISIQAETARLTTPGMPPDGARRLAAISETAREALGEMRRLLGVLRQDADTLPTRAPQPGLDDLVDLVDAARETANGASTRLIVSGQVSPLEPGVELTAYRIVQEALTNTRRHAPGAAVDVELDYTDTELHVRVRDNGPGLSTEAAAVGHGLLGMRERAAMVGGDIQVLSRQTGFHLEARLPLDHAGTP